MKKKTIFAININHSIDLITNSSSELFVLEGKTKEIVSEMIAEIYPEYMTEYEDVKHISELSADELDTFFNYATGSHIWPAHKSNYSIPRGFTFDEVYEPDGKDPAWNGQIQYKVKNNNTDKTDKWNYSFVTEENKEWFLNKFDPNRTMYFLYSHDENPNQEYQEKLETVAQRFHLG